MTNEPTEYARIGSFPTLPVEPPVPKKRNWLLPAIAVGALLIGCCGGFSLATMGAEEPKTVTVFSPSPYKVTEYVLVTPSAAAPVPAKSTAPAKAVVTFGDGMWEVPGEVVPGTYKTVVPADSNNCYYSVLKDFDDGFDSILSNGNQAAGKPVIITVPKTAKGVDMRGCGTWVKIK